MSVFINCIPDLTKVSDNVPAASCPEAWVPAKPGRNPGPTLKPEMTPSYLLDTHSSNNELEP